MDFINLINSISLEYKFIVCDSEKLILKSKELRHLIYCEEKSWEPQQCARIEQDEYDVHSLHYLVVCRKTSLNIATFRLIMGGNLPLSKYMSDDNILHPKHAPFNSVCEVSRFSMLKEYRNAKLLQAFLLLVGYEAAKKGFVGAYMVMEKSLAIRIRRNNIYCRQITDTFMLNGNRAIYFCSAAESLNTIGSVVGYEKRTLELLFKPCFESESSIV